MEVVKESAEADEGGEVLDCVYGKAISWLTCSGRNVRLLGLEILRLWWNVLAFLFRGGNAFVFLLTRSVVSGNLVALYYFFASPYLTSSEISILDDKGRPVTPSMSVGLCPNIEFS